MFRNDSINKCNGICIFGREAQTMVLTEVSSCLSRVGCTAAAHPDLSKFVYGDLHAHEIVYLNTVSAKTLCACVCMTDSRFRDVWNKTSYVPRPMLLLSF